MPSRKLAALFAGLLLAQVPTVEWMDGGAVSFSGFDEEEVALYVSTCNPELDIATDGVGDCFKIELPDEHMKSITCTRSPYGKWTCVPHINTDVDDSND